MEIESIVKKVAGKEIKYNAVNIEGQYLIIAGKNLKIASLREEWDEDIINPSLIIENLKQNGIGVDLFTFVQRLPDTKPMHDYKMEWDNIVAIPVISFENWWKNVKRETRKCLRKAEKSGVTVRIVDFDDELLRGIKDIYDETPIRQGKLFWHYKKDLNELKEGHITYLDRSVFIGAYFKNEMIGFIKIIFTDRYAYMIQFISKMSHRDKSPANALIAKAVELCETRKSPFLTYGRSSKGGLNDFKINNGFHEYLLPRYYIPISIKGSLSLNLHLHHGLVEFLPKQLILPLKNLRKMWYSRKYINVKSDE